MPHRLNAYLASSQEFRQLSLRVKQLATLQQLYESIVPPALKRGSHVLQLQQQTLFIAASNGAVAGKLRQMKTELISLLRARGCEVTGIQIKVQVTNLAPLLKTEPRRLGKEARKALQELEDNLTDSPLKSALARLARNT